MTSQICVATTPAHDLSSCQTPALDVDPLDDDPLDELDELAEVEPADELDELESLDDVLLESLDFDFDSVDVDVDESLDDVLLELVPRLSVR